MLKEPSKAVVQRFLNSCSQQFAIFFWKCGVRFYQNHNSKVCNVREAEFWHRFFSLRFSNCFQLFPWNFLLPWRCYWAVWRMCWCYHCLYSLWLEGFPWIVVTINKSRYFFGQHRICFYQLCSKYTPVWNETWPLSKEDLYRVIRSDHVMIHWIIGVTSTQQHPADDLGQMLRI